MNGIPAEFVFALIFAAVLLVQYLMKRSGAWPQPDDTPQDTATLEEQPADQAAPVPTVRERGADVAAAATADAERTARLEAPARARATTARRRSASRLLLGDGQDLQRAVVGMTLLGPCRALQPAEAGGQSL